MSSVRITKPVRRWLFGGIGFHNSEATMLPMMSEKFKNEKVLKCFREISPGFSRVYACFDDWTKEAMDHFADYYDAAFRKAGTLVYAVPGRMPFIDDRFDIAAYCEKVTEKLDYLINVRKCTKIRYFCVTNELSCGNTYAYLAKHLDLLKKLHDELYHAFLRHGLDVGLLATDCSGAENFRQLTWAKDNMDEITADYCAHLYLDQYQPGDAELYGYCKELFEGMAMQAKTKQKRFILGEFGINTKTKFVSGGPMMNDMSFGAERPEDGGIYSLAVVEMSLAVVNSGTFAAAFWSMIDYPDPFIREDGDTPEEKARYEVARFSGHGIQFRYNKNGLIKWCDEEKDYSSRPALYAMGYMAKFFKKGSRVLVCETDNDSFRAGAVSNEDGTVSVCLVNRGDTDEETDVTLEYPVGQAFRRYDFSADDPPISEFCDLQPYSELISCFGSMKITLPARSVTFLSTDYVDRVPSPVGGVVRRDGRLSWEESGDEAHCYYRVYRDGRQICSTAACFCDAPEDGDYAVISVDKYGNAGVLHA